MCKREIKTMLKISFMFVVPYVIPQHNLLHFFKLPPPPPAISFLLVF